MADLQLLRMAEVLKLVPASRATVYRWIRERTFPEQRVIGGIAFWREVDIRAWIEAHFPTDRASSRDSSDLI